MTALPQAFTLADGTAQPSTLEVQKPRPVIVNPTNIPESLKQRDQWICWKWVLKTKKDGSKKWDKPPFRADRQGAASTTEPGTWCSYAVALAAYQSGGFDGIGFVLTEDDPFVMVDLDKCLNENWALEMMKKLDSYSEGTPSGKGYRTIVEAEKPKEMGCSAKSFHEGRVEVYESGRYMTVTGNHLADTPKEINYRQTELEFTCSGLIRKPKAKGNQSESSGHFDMLSGNYATATDERIREVLFHVPNNGDGQPYEDSHGPSYMGVMMGTHNETSGNGFNLFRDWSAQSSKHDEAEDFRKWQSLKVGGGVTFGSVIIWAEDHGLPKRKAAEPAKALAGIEASPTGEKAPAPAIDLLNPPGLAGEVCRLLNATARRPRPELYPLAALHLMALVGRKRESVFTSKLNLMTLAIAPTAAGKEKAQDTTKRLAKLQYCSNLIHGNAGSFKDLIINLLDGDGGNLYIVDEVHSLLDTMKSKNAQTYESKMEAEILTMFGTELYTFRGIEKRDLMNNYLKDSARIEKALDEAAETSPDREKLQRAKEKITRHLDWLENGLPDPFLSLMGHSVPERLDSFIKLDNVTSGFLGRTLVVRCPETREKLRRQPVDGHAVALMESNIEEGLQRIRRSTQTVTPDTEAAAYLNDCVDWYDDDEQLNHHLLGGLYARAPEHLYRIATLLGLEQGTITLAHAQYAHALVKQSLKDVHYILLKAYADSEQAGEKAIIEHARQTIHRQCKGSGETLSRLTQIVTKPKGWQNLQAKDVKRNRLAELLDRMEASGELEKVKDGRRERYLSRAIV